MGNSKIQCDSGLEESYRTESKRYSTLERESGDCKLYLRYIEKSGVSDVDIWFSCPNEIQAHSSTARSVSILRLLIETSYSELCSIAKMLHSRYRPKGSKAQTKHWIFVKKSGKLQSGLHLYQCFDAEPI